MSDVITIDRLPGHFEPKLINDPRQAEPGKPYRLRIADPQPVFLPHPLFAAMSDYEWYHRTAWNRIPPRVGLHQNQSYVSREFNKFVVMARYGEGVIFDHNGASNSPGFLGNMERLPPGLERRGDRFVIAREALAQAHHVPGASVIFFNGNLQNYYHWVVEGMLALDMLLQDTTTPRRTVLPAALPPEGRFDHLGIMNLLFGEQVRIERVATPFIRCDEVTHAEDADIGTYPAGRLRAFQARVSSRFGSGDRGNRICILRHPLRTVENQEALDEILAPMGFRPYRMETMTAEAQIRLFADAEIVVSPHGAGLSNLIYAPPGCKVIEFMPRCEMRPFFSQIGAKLGHVYGMLPCETHDTGFNGKLTVEIDKFRALLSMVLSQS